MSDREYQSSGDHRYELSDAELSDLTHNLLASREINTANDVVCFRLEGDDPYADIAREIESRVFMDAFHNTPSIMRKEYSAYDDSSTFFLSVDKQREKAVGTLRIVRNSPSGLKTLNDLEEIGRDYPESGLQGIDIATVQEEYNIENLDDCWDIGTVAIPKEERYGESSKDTSLQLYRAMYVSAKGEGIKHLVSVIAPKAHTILTKYLGVPFTPLCDSKPFNYLDAQDSQVVYGYVPEFYNKMNRKRLTTIQGLLARKALAKLVKGKGVDETLLFDYKK